MFSPAGMEGFFLQAGAPSADEVDLAGTIDAAIAHGWEFLGRS